MIDLALGPVETAEHGHGVFATESLLPGREHGDRPTDALDGVPGAELISITGKVSTAKISTAKISITDKISSMSVGRCRVGSGGAVGIGRWSHGIEHTFDH